MSNEKRKGGKNIKGKRNNVEGLTEGFEKFIEMLTALHFPGAGEVGRHFSGAGGGGSA